MIEIRSSIQKKRLNLTLTVTMPRWLCAPCVAYLLGTGAERRDGHGDGDREIPHDIVFVHVTDKTARVFDVTRVPVTGASFLMK